ncbi:uncharacterized protein LOC130725763 [Lotus japonicus]|uniref:uncharacterized protein LOC130725763 n=1 Tax=Lotus japonicus TaxID=34305 RepID=UPI00258E7FD3|nr:uncharacterized protein LOC130725763 [Lotus japonicus]
MERKMTRRVRRMREPYILAKRYDWKGFLEFFRKHKDLLTEQIDLQQSTPFHYAAYCGSTEMYEEMLGMVDQLEVLDVLRMHDQMGNTPLHEVAFTGEVGMTRCILRYEMETKRILELEYKADCEGIEQSERALMRMRNNLGETPVYIAAVLGKKDLLEYLVHEVGIDVNLHLYRQVDNKSIIHTAVINQFFGFTTHTPSPPTLSLCTALLLLERYGELAHEKEDSGLTTLQLLANMPSAFKSQTQMGIFQKFIYLLLPDYQDDKYYLQNYKDRFGKGKDLENCQEVIDEPRTQKKLSEIAAFSWMWYTMWKVIAKECKEIAKVWRKKEMHNLVQKIVQLLVATDNSWEYSSIEIDKTVSMGRSHHPSMKHEKQEEQQKGQEAAITRPITYTPLLMAACNGIIEIVEEIIHLYPQSVDHVSEDGQNILYMVVKHRQLEIFNVLKRLKIVRRLARKLDRERNTVLHYTAEFIGGSQPGYALQLQEELRWFKRIEKRLPYHYTIHKNESRQTAQELFDKKHEQLLKDARAWIKETAQSCSAVAVLIATVVFAAAYTVPGGTDNNGIPRFLQHSIFQVFLVMDIVALVSSLASVVMFLSILISPCEMWDFQKSLPRKLMAGFALLFFSMATTMLSFSATVLINIKLEKNNWTSVMTYCAAFLPISIFAMMQFPLYVAINQCVKNIFGRLKKITPRSPPQFGQ